MLLKSGADIQLKDKSGKSSLDYGLESKQINIFGLLLSHKYQVPLEEEIDYGKLLRNTAHVGDVKILGLILEKLPHIVNAKDNGKTERTALHGAVIKGHVECVKLLLAAEADPHLQDKENKTVIDYANESNIEAIKNLFSPLALQSPKLSN